jgi:hypothetical protein
MIRLLLLVVGLALAIAAGAWALVIHSGNDARHLTVGALEDGVKFPDAKLADERIALADDAGFDALNITTAWTPGQTKPDPAELQILKNVASSSQNHDLQLLVTVYAPRPRYAPTTDAQQEQYAQFMATLARDLPTVDGFAVWNEPNLNTFWLYQYDAAGNDIAAPAYTSLLARTYDALKGVSSKIKVYGGNLAPRGFEDPQSPRPTHSPTQFIRDMGTAYRSMGRDKPIMDVFALHPYQTRSTIPPGQPHTGTSLGFGDYDKLVGLLGAAFDGTAQKGSTLPIAYTEFGVQSLIPDSELGSYTNTDSPLGKDAVPEETQAEYYEQAFQLAACQPNVIAVYIFHLFDEADLNRWQSGPYYTNTKPKTSRDAIASAAKKARDGKLGGCS